VAAGKEFKDIVDERPLTEKEYKQFISLLDRMIILSNEADHKPASPVFDLKAFGEDYPPPHINPEWIKGRFMKSRHDDCVAALFAAFHTNTTEGREYCTVRIPKVSHDADLEVFDGKYWKPKKIWVMLDTFMSAIYRLIDMYADENEDNTSFYDRKIRFELWCPDDEHDLKKGNKRGEDISETPCTYSYSSLIHKIKGILLGTTRDEITQIKKNFNKHHG
jgi:hypothetical protein